MAFDEKYFSTHTYANITFAKYSMYWWSNRFYATLARRYGRRGARLLEGAMRALGLSARGYARVLKVARTIADLAGEPKIGITHIAESIQYREQPRHLG